MTPASAQQGELEEIVVTAQFREENLQDTPIAISAVTGDMLEARSIDNIVGVAQAIPNVTMRVASAGSGQTNQAFIRGLGQGDFLFTYSPRVSFYVDDVYHATVQGSVFDLLDLERVEVLRGPQGTLFGRNAVGGAFRLFSKKPQGDGTGYMDVGLGDYNRYNLKGMYDLSIIEDTLNMRISASYRTIDGHVKLMDWACLNPTLSGKLKKGTGAGGGDCQVGTTGGSEVLSARMALRWIVNEDVENTLTLEYSDDNSEAPPDVMIAPAHFDSLNPSTGNPRADFATVPNGLARWITGIGTAFYGLVDSPALRASLYPNDPYVSYGIWGNPGLWDDTPDVVVPGVPLRSPKPGDPNMTTAAAFDPPISTLKTFAISNVLDWTIQENLSLKSITAYRSYNGDFGSSQGALPFPTWENYNFVEHEQFSQELQITGSLFDDKVDWTVGGFYLDTEDFNGGRISFEGFGIAFVVGPPPGFPIGIPFQQDFKINDPATLENISGFANVNWHLTDKWSLSAGIRYSTEEKTYTFYRYYYWPVANATVNNVPFAAEESQWTPRVAIDYKVNEDIMVYGSYATGFTAGGINGRPFNVATDLFAFGTEDVTSYEIGVKSEWFDRRMRLNGALYYTNFENMQLTLGGCPTAPAGCRTSSPFYVDNGGDSVNRGFELELEAYPVDGWLVTAALGYNDFYYETLSPLVNSPSPIFGGQPSPFGLTLDSPLNGQPDWTAAIGTQYEYALANGSTLTPRLDASYRSTAYFDTITTNPFTQQEAYWVLNGRLTWRSPQGDWTVTGGITNLADELYFTSFADSRTNFGLARGTVAPPRQWTISVRRSFN